MKKTKIAKAIAFAIAGAAITAGSVSTASATSTTMYNAYNAFTTPTPTDGVPPGGTQSKGTDGWVWGGVGAVPAGATNASPGWKGTAGPNTTPFGYNGGAILNWAVEFDSGKDSAVISQADSSKYGTGANPFYADIDTAKGAWSDNALTGASGWRHNLDYGLFKSSVATDVNLNIQGLTQSGTNFGFTIFKGKDTSTIAYAHHGAWNAGNNTGGITADSLPGGNFNLTAADIVAYSVGGANPSNLNNITFRADANQVYTILLGGYKNGAWGDTADGYVLNVAAVPVPGAVWLFGSAMAGLIGFGRRNLKAPLKIA